MLVDMDLGRYLVISSDVRPDQLLKWPHLMARRREGGGDGAEPASMEEGGQVGLGFG